MNDFENAEVYAKDQVVRQLCSGKSFNGLGPLAKELILATCSFANKNNVVVTKSHWHDMKDELTQEFVLSILGMGETNRTPVEAAGRLVERVFEHYEKWAKNAA